MQEDNELEFHIMRVIYMSDIERGLDGEVSIII
jgi:hypothetical protein